MSSFAPIKPSISVKHSRSRDLDARLAPDLERLSRLPRKDPQAMSLRNSIVEKATPLADRLARRFDHRGEPLDDLTQVARLGLVKAVDNYKPQRASGFTRFAIPSIMGELKRHFRDKGWMVRVPRHLQETRLAINKSATELTQQLGREPTVDDYAQRLSLSSTQVRAGMDCTSAYDAVSLESPAHRDSSDELGDTIGHDDKGLELAETRLALLPLLNKLQPRERQILAMRYGQDLTQSQIAAKVHLSQMHVSRLLRQSLTKLRADLNA
ncbi:MAG TPA: SigB/SigF/SigG family RNA polymerase sigma factor [Candidatus Stackebrandtia faecavium]|nr:SigB/SigF/SigG family RNA polymerase sigma factor [Candidatus Stackebrandtia faecavium]